MKSFPIWIACVLCGFATVAPIVAANESRDEIHVPAVYDSIYSQLHFSPSARSGTLVFTSGAIGLAPDGQSMIADPEHQYRAAFEMLSGFLAASGATLSDVVELTVFHTPEGDRAIFSQVKNDYIEGPAYPAMTAVTVSGLAYGALVELKAVAITDYSPVVTREAECVKRQ